MERIPALPDYKLVETYSDSLAPYTYALSAIEEAISQTGDDQRRDGIEDLLNMNLELAKEAAADIASNLGMIQDTYHRNMYDIQWDIIKVDNLIRRLPWDKKYYGSREKGDLEKEKLRLKKEIRDQRSARLQLSARPLQELRETKQRITKEQTKARLLKIDDAFEDNEG